MLMNIYQMIKKRNFIIIVFILVCSIASVAYIFNLRQPDISLAAPKFACPVKIDWKGIIPGVSTGQDVLTLLGNPDEKGNVKYLDNVTIPYFGYHTEGGVIAEFVQHRIFFRSDSKVDYIADIIADSDGKFHSAQEIADQLGYTVDMVETNSNFNPFAKFQYDVLGGPDDIMVWSECGMAIDVLWGGHWDITENAESDRKLVLRYPNLTPSDNYDGDLTTRSLHGTIMMKFIFEPTDYESFEKYYEYRIPYGLWDDYRAKVDH
jgi:hypothetical protein